MSVKNSERFYTIAILKVLFAWGASFILSGILLFQLPFTFLLEFGFNFWFVLTLKNAIYLMIPSLILSLVWTKIILKDNFYHYKQGKLKVVIFIKYVLIFFIHFQLLSDFNAFNNNYPIPITLTFLCIVSFLGSCKYLEYFSNKHNQDKIEDTQNYNKKRNDNDQSFRNFREDLEKEKRILRKQEEGIKYKEEYEKKQKKEKRVVREPKWLTERKKKEKRQKALKLKEEQKVKLKQEKELEKKIKEKEEQKVKLKQEKELERILKRVEKERIKRQEEQEIKIKQEEELKKKLEREEKERLKREEEELKRKKEEELKYREEELKRKGEALRHREEELQRKEEKELQRKEEEEIKRKKEEEIKRKEEEEIKRKKEELIQQRKEKVQDWETLLTQNNNPFINNKSGNTKSNFDKYKNYKEFITKLSPEAKGENLGICAYLLYNLGLMDSEEQNLDEFKELYDEVSDRAVCYVGVYSDLYKSKLNKNIQENDVLPLLVQGSKTIMSDWGKNNLNMDFNKIGEKMVNWIGNEILS